MAPRANELDRQVGARIRQLRVERGLSQGELATKIGVTYQQMHKYERGLNRISVGRLGDLVEVFEISITDFFSGLIAEPAENELRRMHLDISRAVSRIHDTDRLNAVRTVVDALSA